MAQFSIITITYNSSRYLAETIESVLNQDASELEYLIVDGGSTDDTLELVKRYASLDSRIRWISEPDNGIADAMNKGIRLATGEIVAHLHSDDTYLPGTLRKVAELFAQNPTSRWLTGCLRYVDENGTVLYDSELKRDYSLTGLLHSNVIAHPATFVRRSVFDEVGLFDTRFKYSMDYDLWLRIAALAPPLRLNAVLATFREHSDSLSSSNILTAMDEEHAIRRRNWGELTIMERFASSCRFHKEKLLMRLGINNLRKKLMVRFFNLKQSCSSSSLK